MNRILIAAAVLAAFAASAVAAGGGNYAASCNSACAKSCSRDFSDKAARSQKAACIANCKDLCSNTFRCAAVRYYSLEAFLADSYGQPVDLDRQYLMDLPKDAAGVIMQEGKDNKQLLGKLKGDANERAGRYQALVNMGSQLKGPGDVMPIYQLYDKRLSGWSKMLNRTNSNKGMRKEKKLKRTGFAVDRDFSQKLFMAYESCIVSDEVMEDFVRNLRFDQRD